MHNSALSQPCCTSSRLSRGLKLLVCTVSLLLFAGNALAGPVTLAWNASLGSSVDGYMLYYGSVTGNYSTSVDVGNYTTAGVSGLEEGRTYYFAVTAYDVYAQESPFSNEVNYTVPVADGVSPTVGITSPVNGTSVPRKSSVAISATATDSSGMARVEFYVNGQLTCSDATGPYTCAWKVPAAPGRTYQLQAAAYDALGNVGVSSVVAVTAQ
jgi:hypothetical protein